MYVYLKWSTGCKRTPHVSLNLRKCMPVVGTYSEGRIDPALWFKVLVLDSVFIDIDRRKVFWTCEKPDDSDQFRNCRLPDEQQYGTERFLKFFESQEEIITNCDEFDMDFDPRAFELFGTARGIYSNLSMDVFDKEGNVSTYEDLVKILHVHILPEVKFHVKHRKAIHATFESLENECQLAETMINRKVNEKRKYEESLAHQRSSIVKTERLLGRLNSIRTDEEFYTLLLKHLERDVKKLEDSVVSLSDKISSLKHLQTEDCQWRLVQARENRNRYMKEKERLIIVKEEIKALVFKSSQNVRRSRLSLSRPKSNKDRGQGAVTHSQYVNESKALDSTNKEITALINSKIKLSGVREAIHLTLSELDGDGVSYGYNRKQGTFEAETDMFDPGKKPDEWMTLNEHVNEYLKLNVNDLKTKHDRFCCRVREKCRKLLANCGGILGLDASSALTDDADTKISKRYSMRWSFGNIPKVDCEKMCSVISEHILDIAYSIAGEIQGHDSQLVTYHTNVYVCYEKHVSEEIMSELTQVYKESFRQRCERLYGWIFSHALTELDFIADLMDKLFPETNEPEVTGTGGESQSGFLRRNKSCNKFQGGLVDRKGLSRRSKSLEHLPLTSLVDKLHSESGSWAVTFEKAWRVLSTVKSTSQEDKIHSSFREFYSLIHEEIAAKSIFDKLRLLSKAVKNAQERCSELLVANGHGKDFSTDDVLDMLIPLICKLDADSLLSLYADINLVFHLTPRFLQGSVSQYCLITLTGAYQHLFERQELHSSTES